MGKLIDLYTKKSALVLAIVLFLVLQVAIILYSKALSDTFFLSFNAIVKSDESLSSLSFLSKRLDEYEKLGFLKCYVIRDENNFILLDSRFKEGCSGFLRKIDSVNVNEEIELLSGKKIKIEYKYTIPVMILAVLQLVSLTIVVLIHNFLKRVIHNKLKQEFEIEISKKRMNDYKRISDQIVHDARNPLSVLTLVSSSPHVSSEVKNLLSLAGERISGLLKDLKNEEFSNISDLKKVIAEISMEALKIHGVRINYETDPSEALFVKANEAHLKRIFSNLINNSIEAGHSVDSDIFISIQNHNNQIKLVFRDKGRGIPDSIAKVIGSQPVTYGKLGGQGLGLSDAYDKIISWGGSINFITGPSGTDFFIQLIKSKA